MHKIITPKKNPEAESGKKLIPPSPVKIERPSSAKKLDFSQSKTESNIVTPKDEKIYR